MKILHITFDMRIGGTEMVIKSLFEGIDQQEFEMSIFCIEEPLGPWGIQMRKDGITISSSARKPGLDFGVIKQIRKFVQVNQIDIIHCHQYTPWVYGVFAAIGTSARIIFTEHGRFYPDSTTWKRRVINPILTMLTHGFTAISAATKKALSEFEFIPGDKVKVIYNGITGLSERNNQSHSAKIRQGLNIAEDDVVFGTVARFDPIKNHKMMLQAFARVLLQIPNAKLIVVGDGEERNNIEQLIVQLGLQENVILTGYKEDPTLYLAAFDIFLLSSLSEGTSMTLLEAMSLSKPCVVTDAGGNPEIIKHGVNGFVTKNGCDESFAQAMLALVEEDKVHRFGKSGYERFRDLFSVKHMCNEYEKLYRALNG